MIRLLALVATAALLSVAPALAQTSVPAPSPPKLPVDRPMHGIPIPDWVPTFPVKITHAIPIATRGPTPQGVRDQTITGILFRPERPGPMPGAVIVNSSGGISGESELVWAGYLAELGIATLVLDSFTPRGIRMTVLDQKVLDDYWSAHDGAAGWRWLAGQSFVERDRILIHGMSRGGSAALINAMEDQRNQLRVTDARFAAHVLISPFCGIQQREPRSTGAPMFFMLGELDDQTPIKPCLDYAERLRAAGNRDVHAAVYAGGFHSPEQSWGSAAVPDVETWRKCSLLRQPDGAAVVDAGTGTTVPIGELWAYARAHCVERGSSVGGDMRLRRQMGADLLRFLMQYGFVIDPEMRAALPDCTRLPEAAGIRRSCQRAAWGWTADAARLAYVLAEGRPDVPLDPAHAVALARLAAARGEPEGQIRLSVWLREGTMGLARNPELARRFAEQAAAQGHGGGFNELGLLAEEAGQAVAARAAFRGAAERYNKYGMANYGRALAFGLGGAAEPAEAERWLRLSIHYENPWGSLLLARALEAGKLGRPADPKAALEAYRAAAAASFSGKAEAQREVARLGAVSAKPTYDRLGPDAAALGANEGYPAATFATRDEKRHWVSVFSGRDALYQHHVIQRAQSPSALARSPTPLQVSYQADGAQQTLTDYFGRYPVTGLLVARGSTILTEHYQYDRNERHRFDSQSMAKTFVSMMIGIAISEGRIGSVDDRVEKYVPDLKGTPYGAASIHGLLQMSSGVKFVEEYKGPDDLTRLANATVLQNGPGGSAALKQFMEQAAPPGSRFNYAGADTFALALVLRAATGMSLASYLQTRIWQPMGAEADATWLVDKSGQETGFCCLNATLRDYARFALLLAHDGAWNGRQIIPAAWLKAATTVERPYLAPGRATRLRGYGYQVWIEPGNRRLFAAIGSFRQLMLVDPDHKLVMVQTALPPRANPREEEPFALFRALVAMQ